MIFAHCIAAQVQLNDAIKIVIDEYACVACEGDYVRAKVYSVCMKHANMRLVCVVLVVACLCCFLHTEPLDR